MSYVNPSFNGSIFNKNWKQVIAMNRALASIVGVRLAWQDGGYEAGTLLARRETGSQEGLYCAYNDSGASGAEVAKGVLLEEIDFGAATGNGPDLSGTRPASMLIGGIAYYDALVGLDAAAIVDLKGRVIEDGFGSKVLTF